MFVNYLIVDKIEILQKKIVSLLSNDKGIIYFVEKCKVKEIM